jgi:alkaline phosphatase D
MSVTRRAFIRGAAASAAAWPLILRAETGAADGPFTHGVASGDPLGTRVVLWTRALPPAGERATATVTVRWRVAHDEDFTRLAASGTVQTSALRDFTVKVDAAGLEPGRRYYYAFECRGRQSPIGRTKTLPADAADHVRLASVSCANYPAGYFNVYRRLADREDLDAVVHLGDYVYEFANGVYGDGAAIGRVPEPKGEAVTLADYRLRYATYRSDADLQTAHLRHPFITVWDDHEVANNWWAGGALNHDAHDGDWTVRKRAAIQAYLEWMPVREAAGGGFHLYRQFQFGRLADLVMLDTRSFRDKQPARADDLNDPRRTMLGTAQEAWMFEQLRASQKAGTTWRLLGQQVLFSPLTPAGMRIQNPDVWDGYPAARARLPEGLQRDRISDVVVLTGDVHSSWALDVPRNRSTYDPKTGAGSVAVEIVTPAISSPPLFVEPSLRAASSLLRLFAPHLKYLDGDNHGYVVVDITRARVAADWYFVPTVSERSNDESKAASFVCERGSARFVEA